ncbi:hypothetical protein HOY80DRAFT_963948 [Tuber brumale]|nr:hypothetical protein HOY80DRAFT_963948 [Tuber brumale]
MEDATNTRLGARILVENSIFSGTTKCTISTDAGHTVLKSSDLSDETNSALTGTLNSVPHTFVGSVG